MADRNPDFAPEFDPSPQEHPGPEFFEDPLCRQSPSNFHACTVVSTFHSGRDWDARATLGPFGGAGPGGSPPGYEPVAPCVGECTGSHLCADSQAAAIACALLQLARCLFASAQHQELADALTAVWHRYDDGIDATEVGELSCVGGPGD
jgi:hypothetical protein